MQATTKVALVTETSQDYLWSTGFAALRPNANLCSAFLMHYLASPFFQVAKDAHCTGATQKSLPNEGLRKLTIPVPPLADQERIVEVLDEAAELRKLRAQANGRIAVLLPALFHEMFDGSKRRGQRWQETRLASLCSKIVDCPHSTPIYAQFGTPYACVRSSDIQDGKLDWSSTKYVDESEYAKRVRALIPRPGDIIFCREGARLGNAALVTTEKQVCLGQRMMLFRVEPSIATPEFVCAFLLSPAIQTAIRNLVGGSASPHLNVAETKTFVTYLPPLSMQKEFTQRVIEIRALEAGQASGCRRLEDLFQSLLYRAFNGDL
jgi:type I restriction enzyme S subunit